MESKELTIRENIKDKDLLSQANKIDSIIEECASLIEITSKRLMDSLVLAKGVSELRNMFHNVEAVKATIQSLQDTPFGFITDKSPIAINTAQKLGKRLTPYTYEEIADCCISALLEGYRLTGNEFCIISGNFYPAKKGKYRKIVETEGLTDFYFTVTPPVYKNEKRIEYGKHIDVLYAQIECFASFRLNNKKIYIGRNSSAESKTTDSIIFNIRVNKNMGDDGVTGKAISKLFSRVLLRIGGKLIDESTDIDFAKENPINNESTQNEDLLNKIKNQETTPNIIPEQITTLNSDNPDRKFVLANIAYFDEKDITVLELLAYFSLEDESQFTPEHLVRINKIREAIENKELTPQQFKEKAAQQIKLAKKKSQKSN